MPALCLDETTLPDAIRPARWTDSKQLFAMVNQLAAHHGDTPRASLEQMRMDLFGSTPWAMALVAPRGEELVGYVMLFRLYRAQFGERGMNLHHLFVAPSARGQGLGRALVAAAAQAARSAACSFLVVGTQGDNRPATNLYRDFGFSPLAGNGARFHLEL